MNNADRKLEQLKHRAMALQGHPTEVQELCLVDWIVYNIHAQDLATAGKVLIDANLPGAYAMLRMCVDIDDKGV